MYLAAVDSETGCGGALEGWGMKIAHKNEIGQQEEVLMHLCSFVCKGGTCLAFIELSVFGRSKDLASYSQSLLKCIKKLIVLVSYFIMP